MKIEIRNDSVLLDGYVNAVARDSRPIPSVKGQFVEQVAPKAFERALMKAENVDLLLNHDKSRKLGSIKEGNLELFEDNIGLRAICTVFDEEVIKKAKNNELRGWSFGFYKNKDRWEEKDGIQRRYLEELELNEVSILDNTRVPAYIATSIETREGQDILKETRGEDFKAVIEDKSLKEEKVEREIVEDESLKEEKREKETIDYSQYDKELEFLKMKGGK